MKIIQNHIRTRNISRRLSSDEMLLGNTSVRRKSDMTANAYGVPRVRFPSRIERGESDDKIQDSRNSSGVGSLLSGGLV